MPILDPIFEFLFEFSTNIFVGSGKKKRKKSFRYRPAGGGPIGVQLLVETNRIGPEALNLDDRFWRWVMVDLEYRLQNAGYRTSVIQTEDDFIPSPDNYLFRVRAITDDQTNPKLIYELVEGGHKHLIETLSMTSKFEKSSKRQIKSKNREALVSLNEKLGHLRRSCKDSKEDSR